MSNRFAALLHARNKDAEFTAPKKEKKEKTAPSTVENKKAGTGKAATKQTKAPESAPVHVRPAVSTMQMLKEKLEKPVVPAKTEKVHESKKAPKEKAPEAVPTEAVPATAGASDAETKIETPAAPPAAPVLTLEQYRKQQEEMAIALARAPRAVDASGIRKLETIKSDSKDEFIHLKKNTAERPATAPAAKNVAKAPVKDAKAKGPSGNVKPPTAATAVKSAAQHKRPKGKVVNELVQIRVAHKNA